MPLPEPNPPPDTGRSLLRRVAEWQQMYVVLFLGAALILLLIAPFHVSLYWQRVLTSIFMFATLAQAINLIAGFTGYPAFGNVVFFEMIVFIALLAAGLIYVIKKGAFDWSETARREAEAEAKLLEEKISNSKFQVSSSSKAA